MTRRPRSATHLRPALFTAAVLLGLAACRLGPQPPDRSVERSAGGTDALTEIWESALAVEGGQVTLVFSETQLTSFLASRLSEAENPVLDRAQIYLRDGEISIYGVSELGPIEAGSLVVVQPLVDSDGNIAFEIASAKLGPLPAPGALLNALSGLLTEAFTGKLGPLATGIRITSLAIADGRVAIVGSLR